MDWGNLRPHHNRTFPLEGFWAGVGFIELQEQYQGMVAGVIYLILFRKI